jgi:hypothetical protein
MIVVRTLAGARRRRTVPVQTDPPPVSPGPDALPSPLDRVGRVPALLSPCGSAAGERHDARVPPPGA